MSRESIYQLVSLTYLFKNIQEIYVWVLLISGTSLVW
jgi:hypothetical protein